MDETAQEPQTIDGQIQVSPDALVKKLRTIVTPTGKKGTWLRMLNDRRLLEMYIRLKKGQSSYSIAKHAQAEWGIMRHSEVKSIARAVRKFRDDAFGDIDLIRMKEGGAKEEKARAADIVRKRASREVEKLDAMGRLRWVIEKQTWRLEKLIEREDKALPFKHTDGTVKILGELLDKYVRYEIELGVREAKPQELNVRMFHKFKGMLSHVQGGGEMMSTAMNQFLEEVEKEALTFELGEDGAYQLTETEEDDVCVGPKKSSASG